MGIPGVTSSDGHVGRLVGKRWREIELCLLWNLADILNR